MRGDPAAPSAEGFAAPNRTSGGRRGGGLCPQGSILWFARHEVRLALRAWVRPGHEVRTILVAILLIVLMHGIGLAIASGVAPPAAFARRSAQASLLLFLSLGLLSLLAMMIAQAMEAVTRTFYVRGDLELILSSPASPHRIFAVRMVATTVMTLSLAGFLLLPVVNMLVVINDSRWATIYGVMLALAALAQSIAMTITLGLFRLIGARRTRLVAQIIAALVGAATVIVTQVPMILQSGRFSRLGFLSDPAVIAGLPGLDSLIWLPAHAAHGDLGALAVLLIVCLGLLAATIAVCSTAFAELVVSAAGLAETQTRPRASRRFAQKTSPAGVLRLKELRLILRDPWLISQSLTQVLYLIPAALLLWRNFGESAGSVAVLVPVVVIAASQLAGGLAWLTLTAEDAPDLIASAPVSPARVLRSKMEAVLIGVGLLVGPILVGIGLMAPWLAIVGGVFVLMGVTGSTYIQYVFRTEARRSQFRHRQKSSRVATLSETLCSLCWAGAAGLAGAGNRFCLIPIIIAVAMLALCHVLSPNRAERTGGG